MSDCMLFPDTVEEFMERYKVVDTDGIYMSKGAELVPIFRMRQWFEHLPSAQPEQAEYIQDTKAVADDRDMVCLSERVTAIYYDDEHEEWSQKTVTIADVLDSVCDDYTVLPPAQPERDIPMKPNETIDTAWGIRKKQAVCPKCDYYLPRIYFLGYSKNEKVTYCETCGQAIDWEGWEWE